MLTLSELENEKPDIIFEKVNLNNIIEGILKIFENRIQHKGLSIRLNLLPGLPPVPGDIFRLEQLFINLIDNSIKYTEEGEISITTSFINDLSEVIIEDTGIGISKKDLPRIFERFYVADKSRSRKTGGTGLGLSIVKHIVILHNGNISVESSEGKGTKVIIHIPLIKS